MWGLPWGQRGLDSAGGSRHGKCSLGQHGWKDVRVFRFLGGGKVDRVGEDLLFEDTRENSVRLSHLIGKSEAE